MDISNSQKNCASRLPCGVCLMTNKICPFAPANIPVTYSSSMSDTTKTQTICTDIPVTTTYAINNSDVEDTSPSILDEAIDKALGGRYLKNG